MKKITLSFLALFLAFGLSAQTHFGIKGGLNFNSYKDVELHNNNSTGWHAGILLQSKLGLGFAFQPELLYSVNNFGTKEHKFNMSYVELPLNLQWGLDLILIRPFVFGSPYINYLTSMGGKAKDWDGFNSFGYGCGAGFGLDLWKLQVVAKWNWAFGSLGDIKTNEIAFNKSSLNGFQLSLGLLF